MALESVSRPEPTEPELALSINAPVAEYYREEWADSGLPGGVDNQLQKIDRAACGLDGVTEILRRDSRNRRNRDAFQGVSYADLSPSMMESLEAAEESLIDSIRDSLETVRDLIRKQRPRAARR